MKRTLFLVVLVAGCAHKPAAEIRHVPVFTLVAADAVEPDIPEGVDLGRCDHRGQRIVELLVELPRQQPRERAVERDSAKQKQDRDPACRDEQHPARQAAGMRRRGRRGGRLFARRRVRWDRTRGDGRLPIRRGRARRGRRGCSQVHGWL